MKIKYHFADGKMQISYCRRIVIIYKHISFMREDDIFPCKRMFTLWNNKLLFFPDFREFFSHFAEFLFRKVVAEEEYHRHNSEHDRGYER